MEKELLYECKLQLEYLNNKFGETGTTNVLLSKLNSFLSTKDTKEKDFLNYPNEQLKMFNENDLGKI